MFQHLFDNPPKASIASFLIFQAKTCLDNALSAREKFDIDQELKYSITAHLLLGIALEGVINDIGESHFDSWTWKKLEKSSTPLKWKLVTNEKARFEPSKEPLQTIDKLYRLRNTIAHPKSNETDKSIIIISDCGNVVINPKDDDLLPEGDLTFYQGYKNLIEEFNGYKTLGRFKKAMQAILEVGSLFPGNLAQWPGDVLRELKGITVSKNYFDK